MSTKPAPELQSIALTLIDDHPLNPRVFYRDDIIEAIAANLNGEWPRQHAIHVRPVGERFQVLAGHQRRRAAEKAGLSKVWAWVDDIGDDDAYMLLATSNNQGELSPLEIGLHVFRCEELGKPGRGKKGGLNEYAKRLGKTGQYVGQLRKAAEVLSEAKIQSQLSIFCDKSQHLCALHALPRELWPAGCEWIGGKDVAVADVEKRVEQVKGFLDSPPIPRHWQKRYLAPLNCAAAIVGGELPSNFARLAEIADALFNSLAAYVDLQTLWKDWLEDNAGADSWDKRKVQDKRLAIEDVVFQRSQAPPKEEVQVLLADPPWQYDFAETGNREIENQYPTATVDEICDHLSASWGPALADDCVLFLWATAPKLREALAVMTAWGFEYKTNAVWDKEKIGMGYWFRGQHEILLVGTRGSMSPPEQDKRISSVFREARGRHSKKPEAVYAAIEAMFPEAKRGEMYQRAARRGWSGFGNEAKT